MNCNYKVKIQDIQTKYKFKVFCTGYDDSEIKDKIDTMYEAWPKASGEGESVTLDNTVKGTMAIDLKGNTSQDGTPTPSDPVDVNVVSGDNTIEVVGKNLFDYNDLVSKIQTFTITGTANNFTTTGYGTYQYPISISTDEIISGSWSTTNLNGDVKVIYEDDTSENIFSSYTSSSASGTISFIPTKKVKAIQFRTFNSNNNITITNFQIEKGSQATTYEPYQSQSYAVNLGSIELCKIGDYQDYIYKENKKWYLHKYISNATLDSTNFGSRGTTGTNAYWLATNIKNALTDNTIGVAYCNKFNRSSFNDRTIGGNVIYSQNGTITLRTADNTSIDWSTASTAQTWLNTNTPIIYYILATPEATEITDATLISQLNALAGAESYSGQTNISQTNDDKPFILKAKALKDLSNL